MSFRGFVVELLGVGDWPSTDGSADVLLSVDDWSALEDPLSVLADPVCVAFDVSPSGASAIVAAGLNGEGKLHVEIAHANHGTVWVPRALADLDRNHDVSEFVCDGYGPSAAVARRVEEAGVSVRLLDTNEFVMACVAFVELVAEKGLVHLGQEELSAAVRGARVRPLVDRWAWSRTKSTANIASLVAATLAVDAAAGQQRDLVIY